MSNYATPIGVGGGALPPAGYYVQTVTFNGTTYTPDSSGDVVIDYEGFSGSYDDLTDKPDLSALATAIQSAINLGEGYNIYAGKSGTTLQFKSLRTNGNITISQTGEEITFDVPYPTPQAPSDWNATTGPTRILNKPDLSPLATAIQTVSNGGTGTSLVIGKTGTDVTLRGLIAGTNVSLVTDANGNIVINSEGGGGGTTGEANTSSNLGSGIGLAAPKNGVDLPIRSLLSSAGLTWSQQTDTVTLSLASILQGMASLTVAANTLVYATGVNTFNTTPFTVAARALLDDADSPAMRVTLGLGTASTRDATTSPNDTTSERLWRTNDLVKQTSLNDFGSGKVLLAGAGGLGGVALDMSTFSSASLGDAGACFFFTISPNMSDRPFEYGAGIHIKYASQKYGFDFAGNVQSATDFRVRSVNATGTGTWYSLWHDGNLAISSYMKTLLDDTTSAQAQATLGLISESSRPFVNLMPDSGRLAQDIDPLILTFTAPFANSSLLTPYAGVTNSGSYKFTFNNSTNGGTADALAEPVSSLLTAMGRTGGTARYGVEFYVAEFTKNASTSPVSSVGTDSTTRYLATTNSSSAIYGADNYSTFTGWVRASSGSLHVSIPYYLDGVAVAAGTPIPSGWHHIRVLNQNTLGYNNTFPYLHAELSSVFQIALPAFFAGQVDAGIHKAPLPTVNHLQAITPYVDPITKENFIGACATGYFGSDIGFISRKGLGLSLWLPFTDILYALASAEVRTGDLKVLDLLMFTSSGTASGVTNSASLGMALTTGSTAAGMAQVATLPTPSTTRRVINPGITNYMSVLWEELTSRVYSAFDIQLSAVSSSTQRYTLNLSIALGYGYTLDFSYSDNVNSGNLVIKYTNNSGVVTTVNTTSSVGQNNSITIEMVKTNGTWVIYIYWNGSLIHYTSNIILNNPAIIGAIVLLAPTLKITKSVGTTAALVRLSDISIEAY